MRPLSQPASATTSFRHLRHDLSDPEEFSAAVSGAELQAEFLLPPEGPTCVEQFQTPEWALDFYEARVGARILGAAPPGWGSLALMRNHAPSRWYGHPARRGLLVFTPPGEAIDGCIVPGFLGIAVHVPPTVWDRCRRLAFADAGPATHTGSCRGSVRQLPGCCFDRIEARLLALRQQLSPGPATSEDPRPTTAAGRLVTELTTVAWECQLSEADAGNQDRQAQRNRIRTARRAEEWLRDHLHEQLTIPDLCLAVRVSRRELEYSFRQAFNQSPREFLQAIRLNAIRRALRLAPTDRGQVTRIAMDHGVTHLGRFSGHYRKLFGESPSRSALWDQPPHPQP